MDRDSLLSEFCLFVAEEKKWWLVPLFGVSSLLSSVILFAEGSALGPFLYAIW